MIIACDGMKPSFLLKAFFMWDCYNAISPDIQTRKEITFHTNIVYQNCLCDIEVACSYAGQIF